VRQALCIVVLAISLLASSEARAASPTIVYVNASAPGGVQNGTSWGTAFKSLQTALSLTVPAVAPAVTQIWVAKGTYLPTSVGDPHASFILVSGIGIYGGFAGNEPATFNLNFRNIAGNPTVLSGGIGSPGGNSYHVVQAVAGVNPTAVLDGFTVQSGVANSPAVALDQVGGGLLVETNANPTIANCIFANNNAITEGGGVEIQNDPTTQSFDNCTFQGNSAPVGGGVGSLRSAVFNTCTFGSNNATAGNGGGIYAQLGALTVNNCTFTSNSASVNGGGIDTAVTLVMMLSTFTKNAALAAGGGLCLEAGALNSTSTADSFQNNTAASGGGVETFTVSTFINDPFQNNSGTTSGGGMDVGGGNATLSACTFTSNTSIASVIGVGGGLNNAAVAVLSFCQFMNNSASASGGGINCAIGSASLTATSCRLQGNTAINGGGASITCVSTFTECDFVGNSAVTGSGGGIANQAGNMNLTDCFLDSNKASMTGGGMFNVAGATVTNCVVCYNSAASGAGLCNNGGNTGITNCTFSGNTISTGTGPAISVQGGGGGVTVTNSILWQNNPSALPPLDSPTQLVQFTDIQDFGYQGVTFTNIDADPKFANPSSQAGMDGIYRTSDDGFDLLPPTYVCVTGSTTTGSRLLNVTSTTGLAAGQVLSNNALDAGYTAFPVNTTIVAISNNLVTLSLPAVNTVAAINFLFQTSPCIDTGTTVPGTAATDILGINRPIGTAYDMGAYEYAKSPYILPTPPYFGGFTPPPTAPLPWSATQKTQVDQVLIDLNPILCSSSPAVTPPGPFAAVTNPPTVTLGSASPSTYGLVTVYDPNLPSLGVNFTWSLFSGPVGGVVTFTPAVGPPVSSPGTNPGTNLIAPATSPVTATTYPGEIVFNYVNMTFSLPGTYAINVSISNGAQTINSTAYVQVTTPSAPTIVSGPMATPNGLSLGQTTQFSVFATDPNASTFTYLWNFGDGSTSTLASPTHLYAAAGYYFVTVVITDSFGSVATGSLTVSVFTPPTDQFADTDGDGFPDQFEVLLGTSPFDPSSTPTGQAAVVVPYSPGGLRIHLALNKPGSGLDTISLSGTLPRAGLTPTKGRQVTIYVGGVFLRFTLDNQAHASLTSNGNAGSTVSASLSSLKSLGTRNSRFSVRLKGNFQAILANIGLTNTTVKSAPVAINTLLLVDNTLFNHAYHQRYTATQSKSGTTSPDRALPP